MGDKNNGIGYQIGGESNSNCESSGMTININPYFSSAWDPVVSESFGGSSMVSQSEFTNNPYQGITSTSHLVHYPTDSTYIDLLPKFPSYGSENFSEIVGSFGLSHPINEANNVTNGVDSLEEPVVTRKRSAESSSNKSAEGENQKDLEEQDEKKSRTEQNAGSNSKGKQAAKQSKESSNSGEAPKENYIHVRARRGQATNSHSLAERVRREKISERMRLLQELVPGCNKITGKAVMLDEIINYVQSLQQQVEFLSMKLATVNPELNIDIDRIFSKDILHSRSGNTGIMGLSPGMSVHPFSHGFFPAGMPVIPNSNPQFPHVPHTVLENDIQTLLQMGFDSSSAIENLGPNGRLKPEL